MSFPTPVNRRSRRGTSGGLLDVLRSAGQGAKGLLGALSTGARGAGGILNSAIQPIERALIRDPNLTDQERRAIFSRTATQAAENLRGGASPVGGIAQAIGGIGGLTGQLRDEQAFASNEDAILTEQERVLADPQASPQQKGIARETIDRIRRSRTGRDVLDLPDVKETRRQKRFEQQTVALDADTDLITVTDTQTGQTRQVRRPHKSKSEHQKDLDAMAKLQDAEEAIARQVSQNPSGTPPTQAQITEAAKQQLTTEERVRVEDFERSASRGEALAELLRGRGPGGPPDAQPQPPQRNRF